MDHSHFLEIIFRNSDFAFDGRDEIGDPLDQALAEAGVGEVTGGGTGPDESNIDVEVTDLAEGLAVIKRVLQGLGVASSTVINQYDPERVTHRIYD